MWTIPQWKDFEALLTFIKNLKSNNFIVYVIHILWNEYIMLSASRYFRWKLTLTLSKRRSCPKGSGLCSVGKLPHCYISGGGEWLTSHSLYNSLLNCSYICDTFFSVVSYNLQWKRNGGKRFHQPQNISWNS